MEHTAYSFQKVGFLDVASLRMVRNILHRCGKDMAHKYGLQHWNNSWLKDWVIVLRCALKNEIYLVYSKETPIATFQIKKTEDCLSFQKLATDPAFSGQGVGSFCLEQIERMAADRNCRWITCEVYEKSCHAKDFYGHRNYHVYGTAETLKYTELKMRKECKS